MNRIADRDANCDYYDEFCRLYVANMTLVAKIKELTEEKEMILTKISALEKREQNIESGYIPLSADIDGAHTEDSDKKKRKRKKKEEVSRGFICSVKTCEKAYGSENSLNQHLKLKHLEYWNQLKALEKEKN